MAHSYGIFICPCGHVTRYYFGQRNFFCMFCGRKWQAPTHAHPVQYSTRPDPRRPIKRYPSRIDPSPYRPTPSHHPYAPPPTPPPVALPAQFSVSEPVPPSLLQPDLNGVSQPHHSVSMFTQPKPAASKGSAVFWTLFTLTMLGLAAAMIANPSLVGDLIRSLSSGSSSGGSSSECSQVYANFSSVRNCTSGDGYSTKPGYKWCDVTLAGGGGDDWSLYGTNMAMGSEGQGWIPNECPEFP